MEFQKTIVFFGEQEVLIYIGSVIVVCEKKIDIFFKFLYNFASTETQARFKFFSNAEGRYRSGTVNLNTVNSKFHLIRSYCEIFFYNFPNIPCLKYTFNLKFHLIQSKTLPMNDFELTVPDL